MNAKTACPQADDLKRLVTGHLPPEQMESLAEHLESCADCVAAVRTLSAADTLADAVSRVNTVEPGAEEPVVTQLIARLTNLKTAAPEAAPKVTFACAACGKKIKAKAELAGKKVKCPGCGATTPVPAPSAAADQQTLATLAPTPRDVGDAKTVGPIADLHGADEKATQAPDADSPKTVDEDAAAEKWDFLAPAEQADEIGRLGRYRILKVLGAGGMGVVFRAEDPDLERPVALKAMLPALAASPSAKKRFIREAKAAAALKHDHVVAIYQVGEDRGAPFLAMEFLEGEPLDKCLNREGKLPVAETLRIGREIAEGLAAAHDKEMIHRDIKPGNIWLEHRGTDRRAGGVSPLMAPSNQGADAPRSPSRVKILDFGLARSVGDQAGLTQSGAIVGTPAYMAPEQASGKPVDHRCDLFSLGCVLYRMCTGETPFKGSDTLSMLSSLAMDNPQTPLELEPSLPVDLSDLIMRLLEKKPEDRPANTHEVIEVLRGLEADLAATAGETKAQRTRAKLSAKAEPKAKTSPAGPTRGKSPKWYAVIGAGFLGLLAAAGVIFWIATDNGTIEIQVADENVQIVVSQNGKEVEFLDPGKRTWVLRTGEYTLSLKDEPAGLRIELPQGGSKFTLVRNGKQVVSIRKVPDALAKGAKEAPQNKEPALDLSPLDKLDAKAIPESERFPWQPKELVSVLGEHSGRHWGLVDHLAFSADGKKIMAYGPQGKPQVLDALTLRELELLDDGISQERKYFPDQQLLVTWDDGIWLWDTSGPQARRRFKIADAAGSWFQCSKDGKIFAAMTPSEVVLWDISGPLPKERMRIKGFPRGLNFISMAPDATKLTTTGGYNNNPQMQIWDVTGAEAKQIAEFAGFPMTTFAPDSKKLAVCDGNGLKLFDVAGPKAKQLATIDQPTMGAVFAPDSKTLACFVGQWVYDPLAHVALYDVGAEQPVVRGKIDARWVSALAFSPDGKALAVGSSQHANVRVWDLAEGSVRERVPVANHRIVGIALTPDSKTAATSSTGIWAGDVRVWEFAGGVPRALGDIQDCPDYLWGMAVSADSKFLATASAGRKVRVFDISSFPATRTAMFEPGGVLGPIHSIHFMPKGQNMLMPEQDGLAIWSATVEKPHKLAGLPQCRAPSIVAPNGQMLVSNHKDGKLRVWDLGGPEPRERATVNPEPPFSLNLGPGLALLPDGKTLVVAGTRAGTGEGLVMWSLSESQPRIRGFLPLTENRGIVAFAVAPTGETLAISDGAGNVRLWDVKSLINPKLVRTWLLPGRVHQLEFASDGRHLITVNANGTAYVLRLANPDGSPWTGAASEAKPAPPPTPPKETSGGPSPLDKLDAKAIPASERFPWQPKELVAVIGKPTPHWGWVSQVAVSPNGKRVASCAHGDRFVRLWDADTLAPLGAMEADAYAGNFSVAFSGDGRTLVTAGGDGILRTWDITGAAPSRIAEVPTASSLGRIVFLPDGKTLVSVALLGEAVALWDVADGTPRLKSQAAPKDALAHTRTLSLAVSSDGKKLATGTHQGAMQKNIRLWDLSTGEPREIAHHKSETTIGLGFAEGGNLLIAGSDDLKIQVWEVSGQELKLKEEVKYPVVPYELNSLAYLPEDKLLVAGTGREAQFWEMRDGKSSYLGKTSLWDQTLYAVAVSPGKKLYTGDQLGGLMRFDLVKGEAKPLRPPVPRILHHRAAFAPRTGLLAYVAFAGTDRVTHFRDLTGASPQPMDETISEWEGRDIAFSPTGTELAMTSSAGLKLWSVKPFLQQLAFLPFAKMSPATSNLGLFCPVGFSSDGKQVAIGTFFDQKLRLFRREGDRLAEMGKPPATKQWIWHLEFAQDNRPLVAAIENVSGEIGFLGTLWDASASVAKERANFEVRMSKRLWIDTKVMPWPNVWQRYSFNPSGPELAVADGQLGVRIHDTTSESLRETKRLKAMDIDVVAFAPDGKTVATFDQQCELALWDLATEKKTKTWRFPGFVSRVFFDSTGRHLLTQNDNSTIYVLRLAPPPGVKIEPPTKEPPPIPKAVSSGPSPLDKLDAKAIPESERFPWQPKELVAVIGEHRQRQWGDIKSMAISPDGATVATCAPSTDGFVRFWDAATLDARGVSDVLKGWVWSVAYAPAGRHKGLIWCGGLNDKVHLLDPKTGHFDPLGPEWVLAPTKSGQWWIEHVTVSSDGNYVAFSGNFIDTVSVWEVGGEKPRRVAELKLAKHGSCPLVFVPGSSLLAYRSSPNEVRLVDVAQPGTPEVALLGHEKLKDFVPSGNGKRLALLGEKGLVTIWDRAEKKWTKQTTFQAKWRYFACLAFSTNGERLAVNEEIWDVEQPQPKLLTTLPLLGRGVCLAFTPDDRVLIAAEGSLVSRWELGAQKGARSGYPLERGLCGALGNPGSGEVDDQMMVSADGRYLAAMGLDNRVRLWDLGNPEPRECLPWHGGPIKGVPTAFSHDGKLLATYQRETPFTRLWETDGGEPRPSNRYASTMNELLLAFTQDGKRAFSIDNLGQNVLDEARLQVWDASAETLRRTGTADVGGSARARSHQFRARQSGNTLAFRMPGATNIPNGGIYVWDVGSEQPRRREVLHKGEPIGDLALSPDGQMLACAKESGIALWDLTGKEPRELDMIPNGSSNFVDALCFTPDGKQLVSADRDGRVVLWDVAERWLARGWKLPGAVVQVVVPRDGRHIITYNSNGTSYVLRLALPELDPAWLHKVAAMPGAEQLEAVKAEMMKRNPGFDGDLIPRIDKAGVLTDLCFRSDDVTDLAPLRALTELQSLACEGKTGSQLADLRPLTGLKLTKFTTINTLVSDLSPLKGMDLRSLWIINTRVSDLRPLEHMKLEDLNCHRSRVTNLSPIRAMPLKGIYCNFKAERDAEILRSIKTLKTINQQPVDKMLGPAKSTTAPATPADWTPRAIAEWTIRRGGKVWIGDRNDIAKLEDLPTGDFEISKVYLDNIDNLQEKDLTTIVSWKGLNIGGLDFGHVELTDDGLRRLAQRGPEFIGFGASATPITGVGFDAWAERPVPFLVLIACPNINAEGWKSIARIKAPLNGLWVNDSPLTDSALAEIAGRHAELQELYAPKTRLTDAASESLQKLTRLKKLDLAKTAVTDAALAKLANLTQLRELNLKSTKVTAGAINALQKALPKCNIVSDRSVPVQP